MMTLILYDDWLISAKKKIRVDGKMRPRMLKTQIKELLKLCVTAEKVTFLKYGTMYQFK
jgi:hypothetical protein